MGRVLWEERRRAGGTPAPHLLDAALAVGWRRDRGTWHWFGQGREVFVAAPGAPEVEQPVIEIRALCDGRARTGTRKVLVPGREEWPPQGERVCRTCATEGRRVAAWISEYRL